MQACESIKDLISQAKDALDVLGFVKVSPGNFRVRFSRFDERTAGGDYFPQVASINVSQYEYEFALRFQDIIHRHDTGAGQLSRCARLGAAALDPVGIACKDRGQAL